MTLISEQQRWLAHSEQLEKQRELAETRWERFQSLIFGVYSREQVLAAVKDREWQALRVSLLGTDLEEKYENLVAWLEYSGYSERAKVQVTNYVNALKRGGLLKP